MNLQIISSRTSMPFYFHCFGCGRSELSSRDLEARADLDGPSFQAWYCNHCVQALVVSKMLATIGEDK